MKLTILLLAFSVAVLSSCTTSYKTGQTPDDVYYSPTRPQEEYVKSEKEEDQSYRYNDDYYEERYLRMKVRNRVRWSDLDDWYYNDYKYRYNVYLGCCFCNSSWSPYSHWNNYYNPYYQNYSVIKTVKPIYNKPRNFNLNAYNPNNSNTKNYSTTKSGGNKGSNNTYNSPRNNTPKREDSGNRLREVFKPDNSSSSSSSSGSSNTKPSTSSSSSSSSSGGSTPAPVRKF